MPEADREKTGRAGIPAVENRMAALVAPWRTAEGEWGPEDARKELEHRNIENHKSASVETDRDQDRDHVHHYDRDRDQNYHEGKETGFRCRCFGCRGRFAEWVRAQKYGFPPFGGGIGFGRR